MILPAAFVSGVLAVAVGGALYVSPATAAQPSSGARAVASAPGPSSGAPNRDARGATPDVNAWIYLGWYSDLPGCDAAGAYYVGKKGYSDYKCEPAVNITYGLGFGLWGLIH